MVRGLADLHRGDGAVRVVIPLRFGDQIPGAGFQAAAQTGKDDFVKDFLGDGLRSDFGGTPVEPGQRNEGVGPVVVHPRQVREQLVDGVHPAGVTGTLGDQQAVGVTDGVEAGDAVFHLGGQMRPGHQQQESQQHGAQQQADLHPSQQSIARPHALGGGHGQVAFAEHPLVE